uniref:Uncharacterized protein n=1 Tax=Arundo donax TaxID=35708 RepID=A0A0A9B546_ARUDO
MHMWYDLFLETYGRSSAYINKEEETICKKEKKSTVGGSLEPIPYSKTAKG